jgi:ABC-type multidrug transport system ATPase subunit
MFVSFFFKSSESLEKFNSIFLCFLWYVPYLFDFEGFGIDIYFLDLLFPPFSLYKFNQELYYYNRLKEDILINFMKYPSVLLYVGFILFSGLVYLFLTVFFDKIFSEENRSFLIRMKSSMEKSNKQNNDAFSSIKYDQDIEPMETNNKCLVEISDIVKKFDIPKSKTINNSDSSLGGIISADHVSFKVYENEIFGILGHNGAGKSTLINIMTGLIQPNQGSIYYNGKEFSNNKEDIRKNFGICPQNCSLFESLTVEQNIKVFARLKDIEVDVDEILSKISLTDKKDDIVGILSGGQKKKLNVGIALMGNPKYVFLDEPSSGLDPLSRRKMWDLLKENKEGKVIFLTTHYMDEADILTDRKLILHNGVIRCLGTSMYLKKHFNIMYHLKIDTCNYREALKIVKSHIPDVIETSNEDKNASLIINNNETNVSDSDNNNNNNNSNKTHVYTFKLPTSSSSLLPNLVKDLEKKVENDQNINNFSISLPSLEELFIKLNNEKEQMKSEKSNNDNNNNNNNNEGFSVENNGEETILIKKNTQLPNYENLIRPSDSKIICSLVSFKYKLYSKNKSIILYSIILPIIFSIFIFLFIKVSNKNEKIEFTPQEISFDTLYKDTLWNYDRNQSTINVDVFKSGFGEQVRTFDIQSLDNIGKNITAKDQFYSVSLSGNNNGTDYDIEVYYNKTMPHSPPASLNAISNSILQSRNVNEKIRVFSQPFSYIDTVKDKLLSIIIVVFVAFTLFFGLYGYGISMVREKAKGLKSQLYLNQVSSKCYWISSLIVDSSIYIVTCIIVIIIGIAFHCGALYHIWSIVMILIILILSAIASVVNQYAISLMFKKEVTALTFFPLINMFLFGCGISIFFGISALKLVTASTTVELNTVLIIVCIIYSIIYPPFSFVICFNHLFNLHNSHNLNGYSLTLSNYLKFNNLFIPIIIALIIAFFIYYLILVKVDAKKTNINDNYKAPQFILDKENSNEQILKENYELYLECNRVKSSKEVMPISVLHLVKEFKTSVPANKQIKETIKNKMNYQYGDAHTSYYNRKKIVKTIIEDVSFGVDAKECFGLLGPNGVGKSTLLNTIIHRYTPTSGNIYFNGVNSLKSNSVIGYCSQEEVLWDELSIYDHLILFLKLRGVSDEKAKEYAFQYIDYCKLSDHMNKMVKKISGGTKRKLSLLLAICGYPNQIILDEPTSGIDPATRIFIWDMIKEVREIGRSSIILTTHSMEEAQELCNRLTILINGRLVCIGTPEDLRMKYASSYIVEIQSEQQEKIHDILFNKETGTFPENTYKLEKLSNHRYKYQIEMKKDLGKLFESLENAKINRIISDYTISQSTLEQVFIDFAKQFIKED